MAIGAPSAREASEQADDYPNLHDVLKGKKKIEGKVALAGREGDVMISKVSGDRVHLLIESKGPYSTGSYTDNNAKFSLNVIVDGDGEPVIDERSSYELVSHFVSHTEAKGDVSPISEQRAKKILAAMKSLRVTKETASDEKRRENAERRHDEKHWNEARVPRPKKYYRVDAPGDLPDEPPRLLQDIQKNGPYVIQTDNCRMKVKYHQNWMATGHFFSFSFKKLQKRRNDASHEKDAVNIYRDAVLIPAKDGVECKEILDAVYSEIKKGKTDMEVYHFLRKAAPRFGKGLYGRKPDHRQYQND